MSTECQAKQIEAEKGQSKSHHPEMGTLYKYIGIPIAPQLHIVFSSLTHQGLAKALLTMQRFLSFPPSSWRG